MGALVPGVLFVLLLVVKHVPEATAAIGTTVIGYRTKIACGLLISFVVGRLFFLPVIVLQSRLLSFDKQALNLLDLKKEGSLIDKLTNEGKFLLGGGLMTGFLRGATAWEHYAVATSEVAFRLSTGFALIVASAIPGDGRLRMAELLAGAFFLAFGIGQARKMRLFALALIGSVATEGFLNLTEQQRTLLLAVVKIFVPDLPAATQSPSVAKQPDSAPLPTQTPSAAAVGPPGSVGPSGA